MTKTAAKSCTDHTPPSFVGHWREWHRGHGCDKDDGKPRSDAATTEIAQIAENADTGFLTDAELSFLRAATTSGDTLRIRAIDELAARRRSPQEPTPTTEGVRVRRQFDPVLVGALALIIYENRLHACHREDTIGVLMRCGVFLAEPSEDRRDGFIADLATAIDAFHRDQWPLDKERGEGAEGNDVA